MREQFEAGNTVQFTMVTSVAPNAAPVLKVTGPFSATVLNSITAVQSDTTHYYALYTMPTSLGVYMGEWFAQKTFNGSVYDFTKRFLFNVVKTAIE